MSKHVAVLLFMLASSLPWSTASAHGSLDARIASMSERIALAPRDKQLYVLRAELHAEHGDLRAARADLERARRIDPAWPEVDLALARCLLGKGRLAEAKAAITAFRTQRPDSVEGLLVAAEVAFRRGEWASAESLYVGYLGRSDRVDPDHYLRAAETMEKQGKAHLGRAQRLLDEGVARLGHAPAVVEASILLAMRSGDHEGALRRLNEVLSSARHGERWLALRGDVLCELGQTEQARDSYRASLEAVASRPEARRTSAALVQLRKRVEDRLERLSKGS